MVQVSETGILFQQLLTFTWDNGNMGSIRYLFGGERPAYVITLLLYINEPKVFLYKNDPSVLVSKWKQNINSG